MKIDISKPEWDLIDQALDALLNSAPSNFTAMIMEAGIECNGDPGKVERATTAIMDRLRNEKEIQRRKITLLKAKFYQAEAVDSEHNLKGESTQGT